MEELKIEMHNHLWETFLVAANTWVKEQKIFQLHIVSGPCTGFLKGSSNCNSK